MTTQPTVGSQPWPGTKLGLYDAKVLAGSQNPWAWPDGFGYAWDLYDSNNATTTITAGDDVYVYANSDGTMLAGDAVGECNWIVTVTAEASSIVEVYCGFDPNRSYDATAIAANWQVATATLVVGRNVVPIPAAQRTYDVISGSTGSPLVRFKVTSGSITIDEVILQVEPPQGLQMVVSSTPTAWVTPPEQLQVASMLGRNTGGQSASSATYHYSGAFGNVGTGQANTVDVALSPSWLDCVKEALSAAQAKPLVVNGWASSRAAYLSSRVDLSASLTIGNQLAAPTEGFDYSASANAGSSSDMKASWAAVLSARSTTGLQGIYGRDYVQTPGGASVEYSGDSSSVGWVPGYVITELQYLEGELVSGDTSGNDTFVTTASPHGESYSVSPGFTQTVSGSSSPIASGGQSWPTSVTAVPVTPAAGTDFELSARASVAGFVQPATAHWGKQETSIGNAVDSVAGHATWHWAVLSGGSYVAARPKIRVQPPDYRVYIPTWGLSPDAVIPEPPQILPIPGEILTPIQDIAVTAGDVAVNFATT